MDILTFVLFIVGFLLVLSGADILVKGASKLAIDLGIAPLVVGLTVVAYGTSAPELAISLQAIFEDQPDLSLGNVVGSNITNILLVLGLAAAFRSLAVSRQVMKIDLPVMLGASFALIAISIDGTITRIEGGLLLVAGISYTWLTLKKSRKEHKAKTADLPVAEKGDSSDSDIRRKMVDVGYLIAGSVMLIFGSNILVDSAIVIAEFYGVSNIIIGLTIIAIGTSLPEVATTFVAGARGELDIAVGNAIGSNIMNVLLVIGAAGVATGNGIAVPPIIISTDIPLMIGVALLCTAVIFNGFVIRRGEGAVFLLYFAFYLLYLVGRSNEWEAMPVVHTVFWYGLLPLTVLYFGTGIIRSLTKKAPALKKDTEQHSSAKDSSA